MNVFAKQVSKMLSVIHFIIKTKAAKQMCRCFCGKCWELVEYNLHFDVSLLYKYNYGRMNRSMQFQEN